MTVNPSTSRKCLVQGMHRVAAPEETLTRAAPWVPRMGITRTANVSGLDRIGIPVAIAVRPNSRSVSVAQGKGRTQELAFASAVMEAVEICHAEEIRNRISFACRGELASAVDPDRLNRTGKAFPGEVPIGWVNGIDLRNDSPCWVPAELIHTDYTMPPMPGSGYFLASTNGLASGNHILEAISAAICEVVERDAVALWHARPPQVRATARLDLDSIDDLGCRILLGRYASAGISVRVWNVTSDVGIPAFLCWIREADAASATMRHTFAGAGCHPDPAVALSRALTEAAQTRLNFIVGARDDLPGEYVVPAAAAVGPVLMDVFAAAVPAVRFDDTGGFYSPDLADDVRWELSCLRNAGMDQVIMVDLTHPEIGIPVVRIVIPGLEGDCHHPRYVPGVRARAIGGDE